MSRPSLREALIALEIEGAVEIKMGSGVYVRASHKDGTSKPVTLGESPSELMQARALIEGESVILACLHGKKSDYRYLQDCIDAMRESIANGVPPLEDDRKFHHRTAKMVATRLWCGSSLRCSMSDITRFRLTSASIQRIGRHGRRR